MNLIMRLLALLTWLMWSSAVLPAGSSSVLADQTQPVRAGADQRVAASSTVAAKAPLRVAIASVAPFVMPQTAVPEGFSIDLWTEIARRMGVQFVWTKVATQAELLPSVKRGDADVAIAAITMTPEGERVVDFSLPYFDSGLQILVRTQNENSFMSAIHSTPWAAIGQLVAMTVVIVFILANLVWLLERRNDKAFQKPYWRAIGEGLWVTMLIIATGEHGERDKAGLWKRILVPAMWLIGVLLIAQLTATVTSSQTVARLASSIRGPNDLPGKSIATVPGSIAAEYLTRRDMKFTPVLTAKAARDLLMRGDVQAIVYDAPTLQYWAAQQGNDMFTVVGPIFRPEKYGIAIANGNAIRKSINETLLAMYVDGTYEQIYGKWFSSSK
ncbi:transporter substrate-binding domain-containing protein [Silvimonas amylolytica]|uniref:Uncharacterized protein n=1 Tax=Silvimonas amylolytica TaxID=449663 RepID=A0ABQ2PHV7_9NEIS|nr:transporter substrate-binding domain-containing protein [Silvimonas amylolytica]GGP24888.1 hypothetical protein GCM10010971_07070 [Silvimonas amylolytica]